MHSTRNVSGSIPPQLRTGRAARRWLATIAGSALVTIAAAGCGSDAESGPELGAGASAPQTQGSASFGHIHGLGVVRNDLIIATHTGLWRAAAGERTASRVGTSQRDVMGFTTVGDRVFGSGHPDPADGGGEPANVGLVTSPDAGVTWRTVALAGQADFHALTGARKTLYGYDGSSDGLLVSENAGRSWKPRADAPRSVISLAADPSVSRSVLAATPEGVELSRDGGRSFALVDAQAGLLAWGPQAAYVVGAAGGVQRADKPGGPWARAGSIGTMPVAAHASEDGALFVAREDGVVLVSTDGGNEFVERARLG